jgi:tetratricopeptide (TPR) repeat protein
MTTNVNWRELRQQAKRHRFNQEPEEAIDYFERALALAKDDLKAAEEIAVMHNSVADLYHKIGDETNAISHLRQSIQLRRDRLPANILLGGDLIYLAHLLQQAGDAEARSLAQEGLALYILTYGEGHSEVVRWKEQLAPSLQE